MNDIKTILERGFVKYSDFGAVGDGKADDYVPLAAAHEFANSRGLDVFADEGAIYYIHVFEKPIEVKTNTTLTGAKFIIDDTGSEVFLNRSVPLFLIQRDTTPTAYERDKIAELFTDTSIPYGAVEIPWLKGFVDRKVLIRFYNEDHRDFVRHGSNVNSGNVRTDCLLVDADGNIDPDTPVAFEFEKVTRMEIFSTDDKPIVIQGGYFETIVCKVVAETEFENKWRGYYRKFKILRPNTTVRDMTHRLIGEPDIPNVDYGRSEDGKLRQSYPYYGFLYFYNTYNSQAINMNLNGHTTYYEDKKTSIKPVPMGSYDLVIEYSSHVRCEGITNGVPIRDTRYWGIMSSNGAKNMEFINCSMSRFDAHRGFWNARLVGCTFGQTINVIGGGKLEIIDTIREAGISFIALRGDYGATFRGDISIINCKHLGYKKYRGVPTEAMHRDNMMLIHSGFGSSNESYLNWDFGYTCYMPQNLHVENLDIPFPEATYVYNDLDDAYFGANNSNRYVKTKSITLQDSPDIGICKSEACTELLSIPIKR